MITTEEITYGKLFTGFPTWFVAYVASLFNERPELTRRALFVLFVAEHRFICSVCRAEFEVMDLVDESALVRCGDCRR
jgi:hypothetical protein